MRKEGVLLAGRWMKRHEGSERAAERGAQAPAKLVLQARRTVYMLQARMSAAPSQVRVFPLGYSSL